MRMLAAVAAVVLSIFAVHAIPSATAEPARLVSFGAGGLRVGDTTVVTARVDDAALDRALDLLWFTSGGTLQVLDLRAPDRKPVVIARRVPAEGFAIAGALTVDSLRAYRPGHVVELVVGKKPRLRDGGYGYPMFSPEQQRDATRAFKRKLARATIVGKKWLAAQIRRTPRAVASFAPAERPPVQLPDTIAAQCEDGSCGAAETFGDTPFQAVVTGQSCGDSGCGQGKALYDPQARRFLAIGESGAWSATPPGDWGVGDTIQFAGDGKRYATEVAVCTVADTQTCTREAGWTHVGWYAPAP